MIARLWGSGPARRKSTLLELQVVSSQARNLPHQSFFEVLTAVYYIWILVTWQRVEIAALMFSWGERRSNTCQVDQRYLETCTVYMNGMFCTYCMVNDGEENSQYLT